MSLTKPLLCISSILWLMAPAMGHGGVFRGPPGGSQRTLPRGNNGAISSPSGSGGAGTTSSSRARVFSFPGSGPALPFLKGRWEFWWEFNHDALLNLRPTLARGTGDRSNSFEPLDDDFKVQVLAPALIAALRDKDEQVRSTAALALARLQSPQAVTYLKHTAMTDPSFGVRANAVLALGQTRVPEVVDTLRPMLRNGFVKDEIKAFAAVSLGVLGTPDASSALREVLAQDGESGVDFTTRIAAAYGLGLTEDATNAPMIREFAVAEDPDFRVQSLLVLGLGRVSDRAANPLLVAALKHNETQVRRSGIIALGVVARPEDENVVAALERVAVNDADLLNRNLADLSLGRIASWGAPEIVKRLSDRLKNGPATRRSFLALALGLAGYESSVDLLTAMFRTESEHSKKGAYAIALSLIGSRTPIPTLRHTFEHTSDEALQGYLAYALGRLGDESSREHFADILREEESPHLLRWTAIGMAFLGDSTLPKILQEVYESGGEVMSRASAVHALGLIGDKQAADFLIKVAKSQKETDLVRAFAVYSLGLLCDDQKEPIAAIYSRDHNYTLPLTFIPELYFLF